MPDFFTDLANEARAPDREVMWWKPNEKSTSLSSPVQPAPMTNIIAKTTQAPEEASNFREYTPFPSVFPNFPPQRLPLLTPGHTRLIVVGGHDEIGKNMSVFQYENEFLLVDTGLQIPDDAKLGAKFCLPDISFLLPLKEKIVGIFITNGHLDHIGGLRYILPALGFPTIYGTKLSIGFVRKELEEAGFAQKTQLVVIDPETTQAISIGKHFRVTYFRENYTIPDACGIRIETPHARIVHTGDFRFDFAPSINTPADLGHIAKIGEAGVDLLLSDSANSLQEGFTRSEADIGEGLEKIITAHPGRLIIATFSSLIGRLEQIAKIAEKHGRVIYPAGRNIMDGINLGQELGYITCRPETIQKPLNRTDDPAADKQIILTTGSEWEVFSGLYRMARGEHPTVQIRSGDGIILARTSAQGNSPLLVETMNTLIRLGATVYPCNGLDIHATGHAAKEEQRLMLNLLHPKYFIPVHGELFMRTAHKKTALELGIPESHIFLTDNGDIVDIDETGKVLAGGQKIRLEEIIVDGHGIGLAKSHVIEARRQMSKSGVVIVVFRINAKTKEIDGPLKIETRWVAYLDEAREIHRLIIQKAKSSYTETIKDVPDIEEKDLLKIIKKDVESFLSYKIDREPIVIPVIMAV